MDSVKCAMVAFMHEREKALLEKRLEAQKTLKTTKRHHHCPDLKDLTSAERRGALPHCQLEGRYFTPYHLNVKESVDHGFDGNFGTQAAICKYDRHVGWKYENDKLVLACLPNLCDAEMDHSKGGKDTTGRDLRMGRSVWDYETSERSYKEKGCAPVPDYSRLALDPNQTATIQLTLIGVNSGFINFGRIDAKRTPFFPFIQPGNAATGAPFPQLNINPKSSTTFDISVVIPQSVHAYQQNSELHQPSHPRPAALLAARRQRRRPRPPLSDTLVRQINASRGHPSVSERSRIYSARQAL